MTTAPRLLAHLITTVVTAVVVCAVAARPALAQTTAAAAYQHAQAKEQTARKSATTTPAALRAIAASYENIVRRHPTSGYADNALWQGAGLLQLAYERGRAKSDHDGAVRLLQWLKREYPTSPFARQVDDRLAALTPHSAVPTPSTPTPKVPEAPPRQGAPVVPALVTTPIAPSAPRASRGSTAASRGGSPAPEASATAATAATPPIATAPRPGRAAGSPPSAPAGPDAALSAAQRKMDVALRAITFTTLPRGERVVLELSREVAYTAERVSAPDQLVFTLPGVSAASELVTAAAAAHGTLVRSAQAIPRLDGTQIRLELTGRPHYSTFPLYDPYRIVIDIEPDAVPAAALTPSLRSAPVALAVPVSRSTAALGRPVAVLPPPPPPEDPAAKPVSPASMRSGGYSLARQLGLGVSRIVIDPGHGGHDPGAQANGISEAELVLDIAKRLAALLTDQPGFEIVLTRSTDEFIPLQERTAIANREAADLFLSIHANSSPQRETRGIETYFLNFASNPQAESVAARENASSGQGMRILPEIVKAIALNNKLTESRELASQVQTSLMKGLSFQNGSIKDLGVKQAPFVVLIGAQMPSVLAEVAFLTNRSEAGLLKQNAYRQRIAQALCDAVLKYQASLKKVATVASNAEGR